MWVIRAWGLGGRSRKIAHGIAWSLQEIRAISAEWNVKQDSVIFDSGAFTSEVYKYVVESGYRWKAFKADDRWSFKTEGQEWLYQISAADPAIGGKAQGTMRPIRLYVWAKYGALDRLLSMMHGYTGEWEIDEAGTDDEYARQVTAMGQRSVTDKRGRSHLEFYNKREDDHYCDCEQMQIIAASATNLFSLPLPLEEAAESRETAPEVAEPDSTLAQG